MFDNAVDASLALHQSLPQFRIQFSEGVVRRGEHSQLARLAEHGQILLSEHCTNEKISILTFDWLII